MCTALSFKTRDHYFGRTLDLHCSYGEEICVMQRRFPLQFRLKGLMASHHAMIGMASVVNGEALFYDAVNEHGLAMAGLNFPGNAYYGHTEPQKDNIAPFEFIPWILAQCGSVAEARTLLEQANLIDLPYSADLPLSPLHWMIADADGSIVVEAMRDGLHIYDDPVGVMTNNPPFDKQLWNLNNYRQLKVDNGEPSFASLPLEDYCCGLGAVGLPGDVSSMSRFVRAAFNSMHSVCGDDEASSVSQFFHILGSVEMLRGCCRTLEGHWDYTVYSACMNASRGVYYYTTYDNSRINCVDMHRLDPEGSGIVRYPLVTDNEINCQN